MWVSVLFGLRCRKEKDPRCRMASKKKGELASTQRTEHSGMVVKRDDNFKGCHMS